MEVICKLCRVISSGSGLLCRCELSFYVGLILLNVLGRSHFLKLSFSRLNRREQRGSVEAQGRGVKSNLAVRS